MIEISTVSFKKNKCSHQVTRANDILAETHAKPRKSEIEKTVEEDATAEESVITDESSITDESTAEFQIIPCCGIDIDGHEVNTTSGTKGIELNLSSLLSADGIWCSSWKSSTNTGASFDDNYPVSRLQNRASDLNSRRQRINKLRINMAPFDCNEAELIGAEINKDRYSPTALDKRIQSLTAANNKSDPSKESNEAKPTHQFQWDSVNCGRDDQDLDSMIVLEEEDLFYDSDPGESLYGKSAKNRRRKSDDTQASRLCVNKFPMHSQNYKFEQTPYFQKMTALMTQKMTLVWHSATAERGAPCAVKAWIELGSRLHKTLIQPKFMWQETCMKTKSPSTRSVLNKLNLHSIHLLDITKIVVTDEIDRTKYPFAKRSCSFLIQSFEKQLIFEAQTERQRDDIVDGLKTLVARLGSKILVGDGDVLNEFFSPLGASVPGDAPRLF